jgi:hypothetical protein
LNGKSPADAWEKPSRLSSITNSSPRCCCPRWEIWPSEQPRHKPPPTKLRSPARWNDTAWRTDNFLNGLKRWCRGSFPVCRPTCALDVALVSTCRDSPNVHRELLGKEPLLVAVPGEHRLAARERVTWRELKREKFLVLHEMHCLSRQVNRLCAAQAIRPEIALQGAQLCTVVGLVAAGLGVSLVPQMMVDHEKESGCVFLPLAGTAPERELNLIRNPQRYHSQASAAFAKSASSFLAAGGVGRE